MTPDEAIEQGDGAVRGKYGDEVRVVTMGGDTNRFSVEPCGGTHVSRTGDIGFFHIGESAVASGVRRIEALAGATAEAYALEQENLLGQVALDPQRSRGRPQPRAWSPRRTEKTREGNIRPGESFRNWRRLPVR